MGKDLTHETRAGAAVDHWEEGEGSTERGDKIPPLGDLIHKGVRCGRKGLKRGSQQGEGKGDTATEDEALVEKGLALQAR